MSANLPVSSNPAITGCFCNFHRKTEALKWFGDRVITFSTLTDTNSASVYSPRGVKHDKVRCSRHRLVEHLHRVRVLSVLVFLCFGVAKHAGQQQWQVNKVQREQRAALCRGHGESLRPNRPCCREQTAPSGSVWRNAGSGSVTCKWSSPCLHVAVPSRWCVDLRLPASAPSAANVRIDAQLSGLRSLSHRPNISKKLNVLIQW